MHKVTGNTPPTPTPKNSKTSTALPINCVRAPSAMVIGKRNLLRQQDSFATSEYIKFCVLNQSGL